MSIVSLVIAPYITIGGLLHVDNDAKANYKHHMMMGEGFQDEFDGQFGGMANVDSTITFVNENGDTIVKHIVIKKDIQCDAKECKKAGCENPGKCDPSSCDKPCCADKKHCTNEEMKKDCCMKK